MNAGILHAIAGTILTAGSAGGLAALIAPLMPHRFTRFDRLACAWTGGFGLFGLLLFLAGQIRFTGIVIFLITVLSILPLLRLLPVLEEKSLLSCVSPRKVAWLPVSVLVFILLLTALSGFAEITGEWVIGAANADGSWGHDGLIYHLAGPKVWLRHGVIRPLPENCLASFPSDAESVFAALIALGGEKAPGLSAVFTLGLLLLVCASLASRMGLNKQRAWWAGALLAAMPTAYSGVHSGFVDGIYAAFVLAAIRTVLDAERPQDYAALGLFCGLAMSTKYTGLITLPILLACVYLYRRLAGHRLGFQDARHVMLAFAVACSVAAPFYLRNWLLLGSPIYPPPPGMSAHFQAKYLSPGAINEFQKYIFRRGRGMGRSLGAFFLLPFNLTYHTANFHGAGGIGLAPLALGPIGILAAGKDAARKTVAALVFLLTAAWFLTEQESRFLIPAYALLAILAVCGWDYANSHGSRMTVRLIGAVIALSLLYGSFMIAKSRLDDLHAVFSSRFAEQRSARLDPFRDSFRYISQTPEVRKVLILNKDMPTYYLDKEYLKPFGHWGEQVLPDCSTPHDVLDHLGTLGVTHILDVKTPGLDFQLQDKRSGVKLVFEANGQRIYRID